MTGGGGSKLKSGDCLKLGWVEADLQVMLDTIVVVGKVVVVEAIRLGLGLLFNIIEEDLKLIPLVIAGFLTVCKEMFEENEEL